MKKTTLIKHIIKETNTALKMYGEANMSDKGPQEVMDLQKLHTELIKLPAKEMRDVLSTLAQDEKSCNGFLENVASALLGSLDGIPDQDWEVLMEDPVLEALY